MRRDFTVAGIPGSNLRPKKDGESDFYSWRLFRFLRKHKGQVRFILTPRARETLRSGYVDPREVYLLDQASPMTTRLQPGDWAMPTLQSVITSDRFQPSLLAQSGCKDGTEEFLSAYEKSGRDLFSLLNNPKNNRILTEPLGRDMEALLSFIREFEEHRTRLLPGHSLDISFHVAVGCSWLGKIYFAGEHFEGSVLPEGHYAVLFASGISPALLREVAAHEARHLWQHATGRLTAEDEKGYYLWLGEPKNKNTSDYRTWPHEIDARAYQKLVHKGYSGCEADMVFTEAPESESKSLLLF